VCVRRGPPGAHPRGSFSPRNPAMPNKTPLITPHARYQTQPAPRKKSITATICVVELQVSCR